MILLATVGINHLSYQKFELPFLALKERFSPLRGGAAVPASGAPVVHMQPQHRKSGNGCQEPW